MPSESIGSHHCQNSSLQIFNRFNTSQHIHEREINETIHGHTNQRLPSTHGV